MRSTAMIRKCIYGIGLFLLPAPLFLLAGCASGAGTALLLPLLAALALGLVSACLKPSLRLPCVLLGTAGCVALAVLVMSGATDAGWKWTGAVLSGLAALLYPRYARKVIQGEGTSAVWFAGLAVILFVRVAGAAIPAPEAAEMMSRFIWIYCVYLVFALNLDSLVQGIGLDKAPSRAMLFKNLAVSAGWAGLFLLVTHIPQVMQALRTCLDAAGRAIGWIMELLSRLIVPGGGQGGEGGGFTGMSGETTEPSWLMLALEKLLRVIAVILIAAAVFLLLKLICRAAARAWRKLMAHLRSYINAVSESYEDQVESLLDWGDVKRGILARRQKRQHAREEKLPWESLNPREQVRRSYRTFLIRHPDIAPQRTARQTLSDPRQADIYEAARYSSREITPEEAQSVRNIRE